MDQRVIEAQREAHRRGCWPWTSSPRASGCGGTPSGSARKGENGVSVWVEDNGPGIPPDVLPRLFEPFFTTKPPGKGSGLGLALCQEYVARAGGMLHAENRPEGGARFILSLPPG